VHGAGQRVPGMFGVGPSAQKAARPRWVCGFAHLPCGGEQSRFHWLSARRILAPPKARTRATGGRTCSRGNPTWHHSARVECVAGGGSSADSAAVTSRRRRRIRPGEGQSRHTWGGSDAPRRHSRGRELPDERRPGHGRGRDSSRRGDARAARGTSTVSGPPEDTGVRRPDLAEWAHLTGWEASASVRRDAPDAPYRAALAPTIRSVHRTLAMAGFWRPERLTTRGLPEPVDLALSVHEPSCDACAGYGRRVRSQSSIGAPCRSGPRLT
jgi:hypothetical protein